MKNGFTLIEALIAIALAGIVISLLAAAGGAASGDSKITFGINGMTEMRCINGYMFVVGEGGQARQVLDEFGKGARCQQSR